MWRYEGSRTLAHYLRRRDTLRALAADLEVPLEAVPAVVLKQMLQGLTVCAAGFVCLGFVGSRVCSRLTYLCVSLASPITYLSADLSSIN
jgi:hypothetical protein